MSRKTLSGLAFLALLTACSQPAREEAEAPEAAVRSEGAIEPVQAALTTADGSSAGTASMRPGPRGILLVIEGENWPEGWHGVHVHASGTCDGPTFESAGGHLNDPDAAHPHGLLNWDGGPDYGDLQNVYAGADGTARAEVYLADDGRNTDGLNQDGGMALIIHASRDDHTSQPIGGAGDRIACAVLQPASTTTGD